MALAKYKNISQNMKKVVISLLFLITGCKEENKPVSAQQEPSQKVIAEDKPDKSGEAKKWLVKNMENYFKADLGASDKIMQKITTADYYDYKTDAMNVDMDVDGSLSEKEFQSKWKGRFDTAKAGIGSGFLITGQDWDEIKVSKCELISENKENKMFDVVLSDKNLKTEYPVKIKVEMGKNGFLIADVLQ